MNARFEVKAFGCSVRLVCEREWTIRKWIVCPDRSNSIRLLFNCVVTLQVRLVSSSVFHTKVFFVILSFCVSATPVVTRVGPTRLVLAGQCANGLECLTTKQLVERTYERWHWWSKKLVGIQFLLDVQGDVCVKSSKFFDNFHLHHLPKVHLHHIMIVITSTSARTTFLMRIKITCWFVGLKASNFEVRRFRIKTTKV